MHTKQISLKHLYIDKEKCIGLKFYPDKVLQALIKELNTPKWSKEFGMVYIKNNSENLNAIFDKFKGVAWVNTSAFFQNKPINGRHKKVDVTKIENREVKDNKRVCPKEYLQKLQLKQYSYNTIKTYVHCFEAFINFYKEDKLMAINDVMIREYLIMLYNTGKSASYVNQAVNSIKFYYEIVLGMPNRFYDLERPKKKKTLPSVLSEEEMKRIIEVTDNLKHRAILGVLYSTGLRISELIDLKLKHIDSKRNNVYVPDAKGGKDRYTIISNKVIEVLRAYHKEYRPKVYLFEGHKGKPYSASSVRKIINRSCRLAGIKKKVTPHTFRHSFATHLLDNGTDLRYIQTLLGHNSSKTTERYTFVSTVAINKITNPIDNIF